MSDNRYLDIDVIGVEGMGELTPRRRRGDGGVYLVVADDTEEFGVALRYVAKRAKSQRAHVGILYVISIDDFQHWSKVETLMRRELREKAEKFIWENAEKINDLNGTIPCLYIREGVRTDSIVDVINEDLNIRALVLGGGTSAKGPGPLVSHFTSKGLGRLRVPVIVVPGNLEPQKVDSIAS